MSSNSRVPDKDELRAKCRQYRASLDQTRHAGLSAVIIERALESGVFDTAGVIHIYWPMIERREIDTRELIAELQRVGKRIVIPSIALSTGLSNRMTYRLFEGAENMRRNAWGTYEPVVTEAIPPDRIDLVVAPALGADRRGFRLGYGGGFYDRFLKETDCRAVSLVYSNCLFDSVPHDPHDVKVDLIVTEDELLSPGEPATWQLPGS